VFDYMAGSVTVVFDGTYEDYLKTKNKLSDLDLVREVRALMVHSVPMDVDLGKVVREMSKIARHLYVTELANPDYTEFGTVWEAFVNAVAHVEGV
jgi:hypothetical protein